LIGSIVSSRFAPHTLARANGDVVAAGIRR
jgi:hypothetical protein